MMKTFADRLRQVIGDEDYTPWAQVRGLSPSTVEGWLNKGLAPYKKSLGKLVAATGIPVEWWESGEGEPPVNQALKAMAGFSGEHKPSSHRVVEPRAGYVAIPLYNGVRAAAGAGAIVAHEVSDDALMFQEEWVRFELGARPQDLYLIRVAGDSMEPTLRSGDAILVDRRATRPDREGVYIMRMNNMLLVKRLQALPGGRVRVTSDNPAFAPFDVAVPDLQGDDIAIIGRVVWVGRRL
jgi:phage repressor protein C with HTH and peptisase S24 domain